MTYTITIGATNYTSYLSVAAAATILESELNTSPWDSSDVPLREKALLMATRVVESLAFAGSKVDSTQVLQFPRQLKLPVNSWQGVTGSVPGPTTIPSQIERAVALMAVAFLDGIDPDIEFDNLQMIHSKYNGIEMNFGRAEYTQYKVLGIPCYSAWKLLKPFLRDGRGLSLSRVS